MTKQRRSFVEYLLSAIRIIAASYLGLCVLLFFIQKKMIYMPDQDMWITPAEVGLEYEDVFIASGLANLHAWYIPCRQARGTVLICHGNAGNICGRLDPALMYHQLGLNVLLFDYRGYGRSTGSPDEQGLYEDVSAVWQYLVSERNESSGRIIVVGRSLGGGPASWIASHYKPAGVVLESTFSSAVDVAKGLYPYLPVGLIQTQRFNNESRINKIEAPVLFVHGQDDEVIPYKYGVKLYEARDGNKFRVDIEGGHNDPREHLDNYRSAIEHFIDHCLSEM
jgi:pimeloyl-ACP methyl ester carboxylesterase